MGILITSIIFTLLTAIGLTALAIRQKSKTQYQTTYHDVETDRELKKSELSSRPKESYYPKNTRVSGWDNKGFYLLPLSILIGLLVLTFGLFDTIDTTEVVVVTRFGEIKEVITEAGFKTKNPLDNFHKYSTKIQEIKYDGVENGTVVFYSKDSQPVDSMLTVQWRIKASEAQYIYSNFGGSVESVRARLGSLVIEKTKSALSAYSAEELISQRASLSSVIEIAIVGEVEARTIPVTIVAVYLTEFSFSDAFEQAVEAKMIAEQEKLKAATEKEIALIKAEQEAQRISIEATASAEKARIEAEAALLRATSEAEALKIRSEAEAKAQEVLNSVAVNAIQTMYNVQFPDEVSRSEFETNNAGGFLTIQEISEIIIKQLYYDVWDGKLPTVITDGSGIIIQP